MRPWHKVNGTDVIAALFIGAGVTAMFLGVDGQFGGILTLIAGYYFGKRASTLPPPSGK